MKNTLFLLLLFLAGLGLSFPANAGNEASGGIQASDEPKNLGNGKQAYFDGNTLYLLDENGALTGTVVIDYDVETEQTMSFLRRLFVSTSNLIGRVNKQDKQEDVGFTLGIRG